MVTKIELFEHQRRALRKLSPGSILNGGVGSGKTLTALSYYLKEFSHRELVVITTSKKRDTHDWEEEGALLGIDDFQVDSWNNITKYEHLKNRFFIFDEQRAIGSGVWSKTFVKIAKANQWIMLSATPGDNWMDYMPVFLANGFYMHKTDFIEQHVEYDRFSKFPKVKAFHNQQKLHMFRDNLLVEMNFSRHTIRRREYVECNHDTELYRDLTKRRWNIYKDKPVETPAEFTQCLRRAVSLSEDRYNKTKFIIKSTSKIVIFYNYTYELDMLRSMCEDNGFNYSEWNGQKHQEIPDTYQWVYLVQYTAGSEGWNCIETDTILFYSPNYSYRIVEQCEGRIDRLNTPYTDLNYIFLKSKTPIDKAVFNALQNKKSFNEGRWGSRWVDSKTSTKNT